MRSAHLFACAFTMLAVGCGGGSDPEPAGGGVTGPTAAVACNEYAAAFCQKREQCQDKVATRLFGSVDACVAREVLRCTAGLGAPGTGATPVTTEACSKALPGAACNDFLSPKPTVCPVQIGSAAAGAACTFNAQCATGYCATPQNTSCGVCAALPAEGGDCATTGCGPTNLKCDAATSKCIAIVAAAAVCDATHACGPGLSCVGDDAKTGKPGACQADVTVAAGVCDPTGATGATCSRNSGLTCDVAMMKCVAVTEVAVGAVCGNEKKTGVYSVCAGGSTCDTVTTGTVTTSTCVKPAADGAVCDTAVGPPCLTPARCIVTSGTAGTCQLPNASLCK